METLLEIVPEKAVDPCFYLEKYRKNKDFVKSPFRYPGGKFYALKHIIPFLDCVPHNEFREPFVGGGSIFFGKRKVSLNWLNDLETDLIDIYQALTDSKHLGEFEKLFAEEVATRERHSEIKDFVPTTFQEKVFKTYYLNRTSYCGIIHKPAWGYMDGKSSPPQNWHNFLVQASKKLENVKLTSLDFEEVIRVKAKGNNVLMYLDPPYYLADQKRAYTKPFEISDHRRLANILKKTDFFFCLSYDDCQEVRELYSWANIFEKKWQYNTANKRGEARMIGNELLITNYKVKANGILFL